ncbi:MAG: gliding motility protein GldL [Bacteroidales bacterium]|nr:gliding motility protein GldL [Bacteroidales bacterium]
MKISELVESKGYKNFMAKLYGFGATIVMIGALFKLTHVDFFNLGLPNIMLTLGLVTEAIIFFFSAFEPLHPEPDWSLVYPELWDMYHGEGDVKKPEKPAPGTTSRPVSTNTGSKDAVTEKLDEMFEKANINASTLEKLSNGLNKLSENAGKIADVSEAVNATSNYTRAMNKASESVMALDMEVAKSTTSTSAVSETNKKLNDTMALYIEKVNASATQQDNLNHQITDLSKRMTAMNTVYGNMLNAMNIKA